MGRDLYVALGDSITLGYGASHQRLAFISQLVEWARQKQGIQRSIVIAENGRDMRGLLLAISRVPAETWDRAKLVTVTIGGNDLRKLLRKRMLPFAKPISKATVVEAVERFREPYEYFCRFIQSKGIPNVVITTVYNPD